MRVKTNAITVIFECPECNESMGFTPGELLDMYAPFCPRCAEEGKEFDMEMTNESRIKEL